MNQTLREFGRLGQKRAAAHRQLKPLRDEIFALQQKLFRASLEVAELDKELDLAQRDLFVKRKAAKAIATAIAAKGEPEAAQRLLDEWEISADVASTTDEEANNVISK